jgi:hypothetical protein
MSIIKGLKGINEALDKPRGNSASGPRVRWLKLEDGQSIKIRFVNELDEDSKHYNEKNGLAIVVKEHTNPKDYRRKALDTMDSEGRDWAEEMHRKDPKAGWGGRLRFYINVLVDDGMEDPYVAVWSMGVAKSATFSTIREYAMESEGITNMVWKLKRNGKGTETNYILIPGATDTEEFNWSGYEVLPLESAIRKVPYADQESFYLGFDDPTTSTSVDW